MALTFTRRTSLRSTTLTLDVDAAEWNVESKRELWSVALTADELRVAVLEADDTLIGGPCSSCRLRGSRDDDAAYAVFTLNGTSLRLWNHELHQLREALGLAVRLGR